MQNRENALQKLNTPLSTVYCNLKKKESGSLPSIAQEEKHSKAYIDFSIETTVNLIVVKTILQSIQAFNYLLDNFFFLHADSGLG